MEFRNTKWGKKHKKMAHTGRNFKIQTTSSRPLAKMVVFFLNSVEIRCVFFLGGEAYVYAKGIWA